MPIESFAAQVMEKYANEDDDVHTSSSPQLQLACGLLRCTSCYVPSPFVMVLVTLFFPLALHTHVPSLLAS